MKVHHLNLGTMCPRAGGLFGVARMVCHALLVEGATGLVLIDAGFGVAETEDRARIPRVFRTFVRPALAKEETAFEQVRALGFDPRDVRHVVPTHLDLDHAGGLMDFPEATVHVHTRELVAASERATQNARQRYLPSQWAHGPNWRTYEEDGDTWRGLAAVREIEGLTDIALVPLFGHTHGHAGVAVKGEEGWLLHAGDAYFHEGQMETPPRCPWVLRKFQADLCVDDGARLRNEDRLRALSAEEDVRVFSAHDPSEFARES